jgi:hypothetical protein
MQFGGMFHLIPFGLDQLANIFFDLQIGLLQRLIGHFSDKGELFIGVLFFL